MEPPVPQSPGEPLRALSLVVALVVAILALLTAFGLELTADQTAAILGVVGAAGALVVWLLGRRKVTPTENVVAVIDKSGDTVASEGAPLPNGLPVTVSLTPPGGVL